MTTNPITSTHAIQLDVPFFPNKSDQCGPSTLASVLTFWDKGTQPSTLKHEMYSRKWHGTLPIDLALAAQSHGMAIEMARGTIERVRDELRFGRPVIAMLNRGFMITPIDHYVVITGLDDQNQTFIVHSAGSKNRRISYASFLRQWKRTDCWALYLQPIELQWLALGNTAFDAKQWEKAEIYFTKTLQAAPENVTAANNLAMTYLAENKNLDHADELIQHAMPTAGSLTPYLQDTSVQIATRRAEHQ
jgi:tetratricopeptide (TPR) repeat protein